MAVIQLVDMQQVTLQQLSFQLHQLDELQLLVVSVLVFHLKFVLSLFHKVELLPHHGKLYEHTLKFAKACCSFEFLPEHSQ